ncbi:hypothetical protein F4808DRAFT_310784 [Astrocystis sublimbata]|nr:hypothetical protein F4808DRAFT_310784 [Astrocystis sublimbata]
MYSKMNTLAVAGLLAAGVMGEYPSSMYFDEAPSKVMEDPASWTTSPPALWTPTPAPMNNMHLNGSITTPIWTIINFPMTTVTVVDTLTTHCPEATTLTFNGCEYPATAGEVITVTNCPCTVTTVIPTWSSSLCLPPPPETAVAPPPPVETHVTAKPGSPAGPTTYSVSEASSKPGT